MKLNFIKRPKRGILTLFGLMILTSFAPLASSMWVSISRHQLEKAQHHTMEMQTETTQLLSTIQDLETGQRGYIITGTVGYLDPYNDANERLNKLLPIMRAQLDIDPNTELDMVSLDQLIKMKREELASTIDIRTNEGFNAAQKIIAQDRGKTEMDNIRVVIKNLLQYQEANNTELLKQLEWRTNFSWIIGAATFLVCVGILVILVLCLFRLVDMQKKFHEERNQLIDRVSKMAYYDSLTGLANRAKFNEESQKMHKRAIEDNVPMCLFLIDVDNFKMINDTHGHQAGDEVLKAIGERLDASCHTYCAFAQKVGRYSYECSCMAARLGGDEFVVMFEHMTEADAITMAQKITEILKQVIQIDNTTTINLSSSIGISIFPEGGETISDLLTSADLAMYSAKEKGKDQFCFHDSLMDSKIQRRIEAEYAVRDMINGNNLTMYYQPIIETDTGKIVGAEALLRGKLATDMFFNPVELITAAEGTNLIIPLGNLILKNSCRFMRQCIDLVGENGELFVSVNVSAHQLTDPNFINIVERTLHDTDLTPDHLILEITETMLMQNFEDSERTLNKLRNLGIRISIDDFGKGYSSFSYLQKLPIDKIKIDISFIQSLGLDNKSGEIVKGIISLAESLGMHTCAEGVETDVQYNKLIEFGCEEIQGYYKHKALAEQDFVDVITKQAV